MLSWTPYSTPNKHKSFCCNFFRLCIILTWLNRLQNVRVSHWPITWPIYLPCTWPKVNPIVHPTSYLPHIHSFHSKWVNHPIPEIQQFQYFTLKIQGQGHGWSQSLKSQCESNILSTHIPFVPYQWALPLLRYGIFKFSPSKSKVKVIAEAHIVGMTPYRLVSLSCQWALAFLYIAI